MVALPSPKRLFLAAAVVLLIGPALSGCVSTTYGAVGEAAQDDQGVATVPVALPWTTDAALGDIAFRFIVEPLVDGAWTCDIRTELTMQIEGHRPQVWKATRYGDGGFFGGGTNHRAVQVHNNGSVDTRDDPSAFEGAWIAWTGTTHLEQDAARPIEILVAANNVGVPPAGARVFGEEDRNTSAEFHVDCDGAFTHRAQAATETYLFTAQSQEGGQGAGFDVGMASGAVTLGDTYAGDFLAGDLHAFFFRAYPEETVGAIELAGPDGTYTWDPSAGEPWKLATYHGPPGTYRLTTNVVTTAEVWGILAALFDIDSFDDIPVG